ncbi:hypothetical protein LOTGIDRAFT_146507, partial [Lottia gigantea]
NGGWSDYRHTQSEECSVTCGRGTKLVSYARECNNPSPQGYGTNCEGDSTKSELVACNENSCPVNGGWHEFTIWNDDDECNVFCGGGTKEQTRRRTCTNPAPANGGSDCEGDSAEHRIIQCNTGACGGK